MAEERDIVDDALGALDQGLDTLYNKVIRKILLVGRTLAYAFILMVLGVVALVAVSIGLIRLLNVYAFASHPWLSEAVIGALFLTAGLVVWRYRTPKKKNP